MSIHHISKLKTRFSRLLGRSARRCLEHPHIAARWLIQEAGHTEIVNPLERRIFGTPAITRIVYPQAFLYELHEVWLTGKEGFPWLDTNTVLSCCPSVTERSDARLQRPLRMLARRLREPVFHLAGPNAGNRAHFLVEQMPRLLACMPHLTNDDACRLLLAPERSKWQRPLLGHLGVESTRFIEGSKGTILCDRLYYAPMLCADRKQPLARPDLYVAFKERVEASLPKPRSRTGVVFISRRDAPDRQLHNEEAVVAQLRRRWPDLTTVCLTGMPLENQIEIFRTARVVIGPHGQGFHHALFCSNGLVIQLAAGHAIYSETAASGVRLFPHLPFSVEIRRSLLTLAPPTTRGQTGSIRSTDSRRRSRW